ncbi:hypothetical protein [Spirosoma sp. 48-14]|uniref:hypothetical protein n=1 Tax=Spirosoma sp. 48-14 TaxID=1895854 RepID=UPI00095A1B11|nr:hypothetical protein [Spirosoma sp. 48-14]OJW76339.1 MAG: hypothetical protein BGO59_22735 [Spirosoma sp. 48-14]
MKIAKFLMSLVILAMGALVATSTQNVLVGVAAMPLTAYLFQAATGIWLYDSTGLALATLAAIPRTAQQLANPGGGRRLFLMPTDQFTAEWPKRADIVGGESAVAPTLATGIPVPTFVEVQVSDNSLKIDQALKGATGYQSWEQSLDVKIAGYNKEQVAAIDKLLNTECVAVVILTDGKRVVVGSSFLGIQFEITHTSGAKGSDRREWTLKAKQDGYMFGYVPLADSVTIPGVTVA